MNKLKQCPEFPFFGASYPDATCIDGYLWDLDKFEDGKLYGGGEVGCPFCNEKEFKEYYGYSDADEEEKEMIDKHTEALKQKYL
ncbi:hypothetical protein SAMN04488128_103228 [Chitinophaga eiseniae]|uniref:Uncharacterized protein n=1 Tax=Chitinophaga eiseniae TaxID=634771 RepID=A0A1T4SPG0_9BACT|nr:hypothetical protein [Chitinophaga eiseniae]SKA30150.1 hypothetical protein SAMN04488128_103228 [Chitinophaga eiseniae]